MLDGVATMVKSKPMTTGLVVIGIGALAYFALAGGGGGGEGEAQLNGTIIQGPSSEQVAANTALLTAQMQSADSRYMADLNAKTSLASRTIQSTETRWALDLADRNDTRRYQEAVGLQSTQLAIAREDNQTQREVAELQAGVQNTASNNARRANRDNNTAGIIGGAISIIGGIFGL